MGFFFYPFGPKYAQNPKGFLPNCPLEVFNLAVGREEISCCNMFRHKIGSLDDSQGKY